MAATVAGFVVLSVGILLILVGLVMSIFDWQTEAARKRQQQVHIDAQSLDKTIDALTKLANGLKGTPQGMQLMVFGVLLVIIGGVLVAGGQLL
jgi:uncharacterized membrane protein